MRSLMRVSVVMGSPRFDVYWRDGAETLNGHSPRAVGSSAGPDPDTWGDTGGSGAPLERPDAQSNARRGGRIPQGSRRGHARSPRVPACPGDQQAGATTSASPSVLPRSYPAANSGSSANASTAHPHGVLPIGLLYDAGFAFGASMTWPMQPTVLRRYATEAGFADVDVLDIANDFFRSYRLR